MAEIVRGAVSAFEAARKDGHLWEFDSFCAGFDAATEGGAWLDQLDTFRASKLGSLPGMVRGGEYVRLDDVREALLARPSDAKEST